MEEITSRKNPLIMHIKKLGTDRAYRYEQREYVCEGMKLLEDALACNANVKTVIIANAEFESLPKHVRVVKVPQELIESMSSMRSPQPLIFTCAMPEFVEPCGRRHILLERLQDPGNIGTIIRAANAFGMDSVLLLGDCADPYSPKTVRASMGAIFRENIVHLSYDELEHLKIRLGIEVFGTYPDDSMKDIRESDISEGIVVIGNEGSGISDKMRAMCSKSITIPMKPGCESLNAASAASVIMWEMCRSAL